MAYVLGFFAADGYMTLNRRGGRFWCIEIGDRGLLENIKRIIGSEHAISVRKRKRYPKPLYRLQIGSKEMFNDLTQLGFMPAKTKSMALPYIPALFFRDFVRGYFDGDGCVWTGKVNTNRIKAVFIMRTIFTSCSEGFLGELRRRLRLHFIFGGVLGKGSGEFYRLTYGLRDSLKLYDFMYNHPVTDSDSLFLERKRNIFENFRSMRS